MWTRLVQTEFMLHTKPSPPFPVRDIVLIPGLLPIFLHNCEIKSGSGLGTRLVPFFTSQLLAIFIGNCSRLRIEVISEHRCTLVDVSNLPSICSIIPFSCWARQLKYCLLKCGSTFVQLYTCSMVVYGNR